MAEKEEFRCHVCGKVFNSGEELADHIFKEHPSCNVGLL